jgi:hypothetical protein
VPKVHTRSRLGDRPEAEGRLMGRPLLYAVAVMFILVIVIATGVLEVQR